MKNRNLVLGIILISLGALWFLDNLSMIDFSISYLFGGLRDLWPLILVVLGISVMSKNKRVEQFVWILFLIILIVYSMLTHYNGSIFYRNEINNPHHTTETVNQSIPLEEGITEGVLDLDLGATQFNINTSDTDDIIFIDSNISRLNYTTSKESNTTQICSLDNDGFNIDLNKDMNFFSNINLNNKLTWDINVDCGAVDGNINLQDVQLNSLDLDMGVGNVDLLLSNNSPAGKIYVDSGASQINIKVPTDAGLKITFDDALNSTNVSDLGLKQIDGKYVSDNYETASTKYDFDVSMGLGKFYINYY